VNTNTRLLPSELRATRTAPLVAARAQAAIAKLDRAETAAGVAGEFFVELHGTWFRVFRRLRWLWIVHLF